VLSGESEATVANFGMLTRSSLPRTNIDNAPGNAVQLGNLRDYSFLSRTSRQASQSIVKLRAFESAYASADYQRNLAFAYFSLGYAIGHMALVYDSVGVVTPQSANDSVPAFSSAAEAAVVALAMLDTAQTRANAAGTGSSIPALWMGTNGSTPMTTFVRLVRSYKAKFRANAPRLASEAASVDWAQVRDDAAAGLQSNFVIQLNQGTGWVSSWLNQAAVASSWHQMPMWVIGMADTTGTNYTTWLSTNAGSRAPFLIRTPDRRFPAGETRAAQNSATDQVQPRDTIVYFRNRLQGADAGGGPTNGSFYDLFRFHGYRANNLVAPWPILTAAEVDLLRAEAEYRLGNVAGALPLINRYRTRNGLPAITATGTTDVVPGGSACVPRTPIRTGNTYTLQCATTFEALKYEKRLETAFTSYAVWFLDNRRWGDMVSGTPLEWPVPFQETNARNLPVRNNRNVAPATNTYGWNF
jgi:hypothetical protein